MMALGESARLHPDVVTLSLKESVAREWIRALAEQFSEVGANCPHFPFYCIHFDHLSVSKRPRIWALGHKHPKPTTAPAGKSPQLYFTKTVPCSVGFAVINIIVVDVHDHKLFVFRVVAIMFASFSFRVRYLLAFVVRSSDRF